jgi:hypothetical protein
MKVLGFSRTTAERVSFVSEGENNITKIAFYTTPLPFFYSSSVQFRLPNVGW